MQTILGAGGAIAIELAKALPKFTNHIRLVSRHPQKVNETDEIMEADLLDAKSVDMAVKGSDIVYLTVGLPYKLSVWKEQWPVIMKNVLDACCKHKTKLVFFDNIYMYDGSVLDPITEELPIDPPSKKGAVRAEIVNMIWRATKNNGCEALIARAADFYGPATTGNSVLTEVVFNPLSKNETANWFINDTKKHSFTFTPDAGQATALLGNTPDAFGQVWHLPTASAPPTGVEWVEMVARAFGNKPKHRVISKTFMKIMGWFVPVMKESVEMMYQYEKDYVFDSSKFEKRFDFKPTSYAEGIKEIVETDYSKY